MPYYDRFDIAEAYYLFFSNYHEGQWSDKYKRLCKLLKSLKPRPNLNYETLTFNAKEIYDNLVNTYRD